MALQSITNINVDFYDKKYILINAKQLDKNSRFLSVTCYNHGEIYQLYAGEHSAYIRYKKPDGHSVFNFCDINNKGKISVELTEQMLASDGICYADLVIVNKGDARVDTNTGEIIAIDNASILSTMTFCIDVSETAVLNSDIESSYEFDGLNEALEKAEAEYERVIKLSKSYAVGNADGIRENEDYDNSKYYYEQSFKSAGNSETSALNAANSEKNAETYMHDALTYSQNAQTFMGNTKTYMDNAKTSETNAYNSEQNAKTSEANALASEQNAKLSEDNALISEQNSKTSEVNASVSEQNASASEANASNSALMAQSYAVGGTAKRDEEDTDNAKWYYTEMKDMFIGLNIVFVPKGTISFSELATVKETAVAGYVYNIKDNFTTDDTFREGAGMSYTAGVNVYYTVDGYWDCFGGSSQSIATLSEVKEYLGI